MKKTNLSYFCTYSQFRRAFKEQVKLCVCRNKSPGGSRLSQTGKQSKADPETEWRE